jgi:undecaprenyl phosphate N,N'-diacetylbacillosamine 1-phosphate transferase
MNKTTSKIQEYGKICLDFLGAWIGLIILSPIIYGIAILIRVDSPGPVFFRQERIGKDGKPFMSYKFRSMVDKAITMGLGLNVSVDDDRITRVGKFLRTTSLDELPQLFNVLKGEMSLVGPRPTLGYQVEAYDATQRRRLKVKPGITGWAQINGRNAIPWEDRIKLDVWYVDNWSLWLDMKILGRTIKTVFKREGLYGPEGVNYDFKGTVTSEFKEDKKEDYDTHCKSNPF